jgi:hypothetical protein
MRPHQTAQATERPPPTQQHARTRSKLDVLHSTCRRPALVIDTLGDAVSAPTAGWRQ